MSASEEAIAHSTSSRLNHLPEVRFTQQPNNKITAATLSHATDVSVVCPNLTSAHPSHLSYLFKILANTLVETSTTRHLFVIAASGPSENADVPSLPGADPQPSWQVLGPKLIKAGLQRPRAVGVCVHVYDRKTFIST
jgi:hypothetical protein